MAVTAQIRDDDVELLGQQLGEGVNAWRTRPVGEPVNEHDGARCAVRTGDAPGAEAYAVLGGEHQPLLTPVTGSDDVLAKVEA